MDRILEKNIHGNYRIIAISDIHGGVDFLKKLLEKVKIKSEDYLIILGDFIQKGEKSYETLRYIIELSKRRNTYILSGNHEQLIYNVIYKYDDHILEMSLNFSEYPHLLEDLIDKNEIKKLSLEEIRERLKLDHKEELEFIKNLPFALKINNMIFTHAGIEKVSNWKDTEEKIFLSKREFLNHGHSEEEYVIVGHWPVQNYYEKSLRGDIYIDHEKKIISIDGGYGVKKVGQLNALIIEKIGDNIGFLCENYDGFKERKIIKENKILDNGIVKLDWRDCDYEVIEEQPEFSRCVKIGSGEEFLLKNELIGKNLKTTSKEDYISLFLGVKKGDKVGIIELLGSYYLAKFNGEIGWVHKSCVEGGNDE